MVLVTGRMVLGIEVIQVEVALEAGNHASETDADEVIFEIRSFRNRSPSW